MKRGRAVAGKPAAAFSFNSLTTRRNSLIRKDLGQAGPRKLVVSLMLVRGYGKFFQRISTYVMDNCPK
jgi:hypothetical protein